MKMYYYGRDCFAKPRNDDWVFHYSVQSDTSSLRGTKQSLSQRLFSLIEYISTNGRDCFAKPRNDERYLKISLFTILLISLSLFSSAQKTPEKNWSSSRILHEINKLKHVGRVLYIAAHPDDENTQLIAYLANVKGIDVAYMSLTRGDGGQDLLGPEVREELGVIRTQELLMARATDGGQQFFSRANDFGFSKTAKETMHIWDSNEVLSDIVWEIRRFKPDIIITRFSPTYAKTHGHHQASAILTVRAFAQAADPTKFPQQLKYVQTWQATSLYWNTSTFFYQDNKLDTAGLYYTNIGTYMPLLGKSVGEMAAESRSMHKSQGFGVSARRGDIMEYFVSLAGKKPDNRDIFSVTNWDWSRIKGCEDIPLDIDILNQMNTEHPSYLLEKLGTLYAELSKHSDNYLVQSKIKQLQEIILQCAGVYTEAISTKQYLPPTDSINVSLGSVSPDCKVTISATLLIDGKEVGKMDNPSTLNPNTFKTINLKGIVPENVNITGPYWLEQEPTVGMYKVDDQLMRGLPQNPPQITVHLFYTIEETDATKKTHLAVPTHEPISFEQDIPVFYKNTDPVKGEIYSLARIVPPAVANPQEHILVFANNDAKEIHIKVKSFKKGKAILKLYAPKSWSFIRDSVNPIQNIESQWIFWKDINMKGEGTEQTFTFKLKPPALPDSGEINIWIDDGKHLYNRSLEDINYDHIPEQMLLPESKVKVVRMEITTHPKLIGYINGAGDDIPAALKEMGYKVEMIAPSQIATINLSKYDAIIAGVRAYNTVDRLKYDNGKLMDYVKNGGNYIVQYNNNFRLVTDSIGPYYLHPANVRTTEEDSKVTFLNPDNPALNTPNKITQKDFEGWIQERGLYYPDKWDTAHYVPLLEMNDTGEPPTKGALLVAQYGKGNFVYTGIVFFRELPAGVPGAYRLLANLIELGKH
jgi:LmbE family N-acetylglucosaminyl deacetylase